MIDTILITVIVEGVVVIIYCARRQKPVVPILLTSVFGNLFTQSLLWIVMGYSFRHYLIALSVTEIMIWGIESILFCAIPANHLKLNEAVLLSLVINGTSLVLGWFLPV